MYYIYAFLGLIIAFVIILPNLSYIIKHDELEEKEKKKHKKKK